MLEAGGRPWRLSLPKAALTTHVSMDVQPSAAVVFRFAVSRDEEHVALTALWRDGSFTPRARPHAYTLLTLARIRLADDRDRLGARARSRGHLVGSIR